MIKPRKFALTAVLAISLEMTVFSPSNVTAQQTAQVAFSQDADVSANRWIRANADGMAVAIRLGDATPVAPRVIEDTLRADFANHGITKLRFFFERGGTGGSSVMYRSSNHAWGPYGLADARNNVAEPSAQLRFEIARGLN